MHTDKPDWKNYTYHSDCGWLILIIESDDYYEPPITEQVIHVDDLDELLQAAAKRWPKGWEFKDLIGLVKNET